MLPKISHYLLNVNSPIGFEKYLQYKQEGRWLVFNPFFLFFQGFWFIFHRMYLEAFLYIFLLASFSGLLYISSFIYSSVFFGTMILMSFFSFKLYELKANRVLLKNNFSPKLYINKMTPYVANISLLILILSSFLLFFTFLLINLELYSDLFLQKK